MRCSIPIGKRGPVNKRFDISSLFGWLLRRFRCVQDFFGRGCSETHLKLPTVTPSQVQPQPCPPLLHHLSSSVLCRILGAFCLTSVSPLEVDVGIAVGDTVGATDGDRVGPIDGAVEGDNVGVISVVGALVGATVAPDHGGPGCRGSSRRRGSSRCYG